ncbi:dephospho-CoA kinase [Comamonas piscis]|uniref:Dephospho-CoA kinase n=1 Tax=Comamonas piscis TaxID=1562974 RepID=A0A7G5EMD4_9BURK|nr:dephospho-CoA kinase [Comamonas piscis]QMV75159.1 dephospho-CoA kinase [Comamonas piscis]WSO33648.1 dephospho-CoA kinase [Comamonas piscis]
MRPRIGVTGGIGSGKSTVTQGFAQWGCHVIDADQIARSLTLAGGAAIAPIAAQMGAHFIGADGALDRAQMRDAAFREPAFKAQLEGILHPLIRQLIDQQYQQASTETDAPLVIFDIPLLAESSQWSPRLDQVIVVDCLESTQIARVQQRNQLSKSAIEAIMAQQASRLQRLRKADWVLWNETLSLQALGDQVFDLYNQLIANYCPPQPD